MLSKRNRRHRISQSQPPPRPRETLCHNHTHTHGHKHKTQTHSNSRSHSHSYSYSYSHMQPPHRRHGQRKANATRARERVVPLTRARSQTRQRRATRRTPGSEGGRPLPGRQGGLRPEWTFSASGVWRGRTSWRRGGAGQSRISTPAKSPRPGGRMDAALLVHQ
jgi:hypothetical protein